MQEELLNNNPILKSTVDFSLLVIEYCESLQASKKFVLANQLFKSGTSIGANCMESQNAESKADFIHKMKIAAKEADETQYWLRRCDSSKTYPGCKTLLLNLHEINMVLGKILAASKQKSPI